MKKLLLTFLLLALPLQAFATTQILSGRSNGSGSSATHNNGPWQINQPANGTASGVGILAVPGTLSNFYAYTNTPLTGTQTWTVTVQKANGLSTTLTCTINHLSTTNGNGDQFCSDTTDTAAVLGGATINVNFVAANTPNAGITYFTMQFTPTTPGQTSQIWNTVNVLSQTVQQFMPATFELTRSATEAAVQTIMPEAGTIFNATSTVSVAYTSGSNAFILRVNTATSSPQLGCTVTSQMCADLTDQVSTLAGALIDWVSEPASPSGSDTVAGAFGFTPTTVGDYDILSESNVSDANNTNRYLMYNVLSATEASTSVPADASSVTGISAYVQTAPGAGKTRTFYLRDEDAGSYSTTTCKVAITGTNTSATNTCSVSLPIGDKIDITDEPTSAPSIGGGTAPAATALQSVSLSLSTSTPSVTTSAPDSTAAWWWALLSQQFDNLF